jgi:hypothetical protein
MAVIRSRIAAPVLLNNYVTNIINISYSRSQIWSRLLQSDSEIQCHAVLRYDYLESFFRSTVNEQRISFKSDVILQTFANH